MRLDKEIQVIKRRDQITEEFKEASQSYKRAKISAELSQSMIGKWQDIEQSQHRDDY